MLPAANNFYRAFTDPSGGSDDSFALAISHKSKDRIIIDAIREARPPLMRWSMTSRRCENLSRQPCDRRPIPGEFPRELFRKDGIRMTWPSRPRVNCSAISSRF